MTNNQFVTKYLIHNKNIRKTFDHLTRGSIYKDDLWQEVMVIYLEMPMEKLEPLVEDGNDRIRAHFINVVKKQLHSSTSPFYYKFRKESEVRAPGDYNEYLDSITDEDDEENMVDVAYENVKAKMHWYDRELYELYIKHYNKKGTYKVISKETKIPYGAVATALLRIRNEVRTKIKEELNRLERGKLKKYEI